MEDLKIALIQTEIFWEDTAANLAMLEEKIWNISENVDLIILPEMFNSGFSMNAQKIAEPINGHTTKWMKQMASQTKAVLCGSFAIKEKDFFYNRFHFVEPNGTITTYDKIHTFSLAGENEIYQNGTKTKIIHYKNWKISPQICYDLRFPETALNQVIKSEYAYDLLIYVANWSESRIAAWTHLLEARAIENSCYTIGVNRIGNDHRKQIYNGQSAVCFALPNKNIYLNNAEETKIHTLLANDLLDYRKKYPFLIDAKKK